MVNNRTLAEISEGEGIRGREGEKLSDAFEVAIALHYTAPDSIACAYGSGGCSTSTWTSERK